MNAVILKFLKRITIIGQRKLLSERIALVDEIFEVIYKKYQYALVPAYIKTHKYSQ